MTRKLFSLVLGSFTVLLLMGAGVEDSTATEQLQEQSEQQVQSQVAMVSAVAGTKAFDLGQEELTDTEVAEDAVDEAEGAETQAQSVATTTQASAAETGAIQYSETTYVPLVPMAERLVSGATVAWDTGSQTVTVQSAALNMTAKVGQQYVVANDRYLYVADGVQIQNGQVTVPMGVIAKAFGANVSTDPATGGQVLTAGSGTIQSGSQYYDSEAMYWLSHVIYSESGNQSLEGQMAVGNVVLNRVASPIFPNSIEGVLAQKNQFTTYYTGAIQNCNPSDMSIIAAKLVLDGGVVEEVRNAMYFDSANSSWASRNRTCIATIGNHRFYL